MEEAKKQDLTKPIAERGLVSLSADLRLKFSDYTNLQEYLVSRIQYAFNKTTWRAKIMDEIDEQLLGAVELRGKDRARARNNRKGKSAKVTDVNLALGQAQIDTAVTALLDMLVPTDKMYEPFGNAESQSAALAVTAELNKSADKFNHISEYHKAISDVLRYNIGGLEVKWTDIVGSKLTNSLLGQPEVLENTVVFSGNKLKALDMRNAFYDQTVEPEYVSTQGSYAGYVDIIGVSQLNEMIDRGEVYAEYVDDSWMPVNDLLYYNQRPELRTPAITEKDSRRVSYDTLFGINESPDKAIYLITCYAKIRPQLFGLSEDSGIQVWQFQLIGSRIISAKPMANAHSRLPIVFASATCDSLGAAMIGYSETLIPMQNFASFLINARQRGYTKQLYGLTFYDKNKIDMRQVLNATDDNRFENAYIPVDVSDGGSVGNFVQSFNDAPDTAGTLGDISAVVELMQTLLPTDSRQALGNLSRVSQWQAQRTVRETDKRTIKIGRLLNASLISPVIYQSVYNVLQFMTDIPVRQDDGTIVNVDVSELRDQDLELKISSALRGIDKDLAADRLRDVINSLIQVPNISSDINIISLVRYWSTLMGINIDLAQFKVDSPFDKLTPEQKQAAYQLLMTYVQQQQAQQAVPNAVSTVDPGQASRASLARVD